MDLAKLDTRKACDEGAFLELKHPETMRPMGIKIKLAGLDSERFNLARNEMAAKRANASMTPLNMKRMQQGRSIEVTASDLDDQQRDATKILAAITLEWEGFVWEGEELPCTKDNAFMVYDRLPW